MDLLADIAAIQGNRSVERTYLKRSLLYDPTQPVVKKYLGGTCHPVVVITQFGGRTITTKCSGH